MRAAVIAVFLCVVFGAVGLYVLQYATWQEPADSAVALPDGHALGAPSDFARTGNVTHEEYDGGVIRYLVYEEPGAPALRASLLLDDLSACVAEGKVVPCFDFLTPGVRVSIEGVRDEGDSVVVRKAGIPTGDPPATGDVFVSWQTVERLVRACGATAISENDSLDVFLTDARGVRVRAVAPGRESVRLLVETSDCAAMRYDAE